MWKFCGNAQLLVSGDFLETLRKLCASKKIPLQEIGEVLVFYDVIDALLLLDREALPHSLSEIATRMSWNE